MAERAKTAQKGKGGQNKRPCPACKEADIKVVKYAGFGQKKGFYWTCDSNSCDYSVRTH